MDPIAFKLGAVSLQHTRAFERASHATLPAGVERLSMELMTLRAFRTA